MNVYAKACTNLFFPAHEWLKGHGTVAARHELERSQWLGREELERLQIDRLGALLRYAGAHVPYYRDLFKRLDFEPTTLGSLRDLARLPVLDKATMRANMGRLRADEAADMKMFSTTGSSGDPLRFLIGKRRLTREVAAKWRATRWWSVDIGDREVVAWSSPIELSAQDRMRRLRDLVLRTRLVRPCRCRLSDSTTSSTRFGPFDR